MGAWIVQAEAVMDIIGPKADKAHDNAYAAGHFRPCSRHGEILNTQLPGRGPITFWYDDEEANHS